MASQITVRLDSVTDAELQALLRDLAKTAPGISAAVVVRAAIHDMHERRFAKPTKTRKVVA